MERKILLKQLHDGLRQYFPAALWQGSSQRREIALTFDAGPNDQETPELLTLLDQYRVTATFFHVGVRAAAAPRLVKQVTAAGHQIGLHGYEHQSFLFKDSATLCQELAESQRLLAEASGRSQTAFNAVRPPFGHFTPAILQTLNDTGYLPTMWSLVPFHWLQSAEATVRQVITGVDNGAIIVFHEGLPGPNVAKLTATILPQLLAEGYRFVTIHEMWANLQRNMP